MFRKLVTDELAKAKITVSGGERADMHVFEPRFYRRAALFGPLGVGDSYIDRDVIFHDLESFFENWMTYQLRSKDSRLKGRGTLRKFHSMPEAWIKFLCIRNQQTITLAKRVGKHHYDIGNALYRAMLGPTMAYSCGYWPGAKTLDEAQRNKYRLICEKLGLRKGMRILEIGCGWGGFAAFAVKEYGVTVVGVSISREQIRSIQAEHKDLCDAGSIDLRFMDYRQITEEFKEEFDAVVSVGMFEHVGPRNYREYMRIAWLALKPGGLFLLHTIVGNGGIDPFIWYRIFLGGVLPIEQQILKAARGYFVKERSDNIGFNYYRTLIAWWKNFEAAWPELKQNCRYDEKFYRMWEFYLKGCAVAFKVRRIHVGQYVFSKGGVKGGYEWSQPEYTA